MANVWIVTSLIANSSCMELQSWKFEQCKIDLSFVRRSANNDRRNQAAF